MRDFCRRPGPSVSRTARILLFRFLVGASVAAFSSPAQVKVLTYHNDNARTGQNTNETTLTPANVNTNTFGLLFACAVDGQLYAQPLYMSGMAITNQGIHNVVFVATEHDSVYAFDADSNPGSNPAPLWKVSLINPAAGLTTVPSADVNSGNIAPEIGITSTPVIDPDTMTLYVETKTKQVEGGATNYVHRLHALDVGSGAEKFGGPVVIQPLVSGDGQGNNGAGRVPFNALRQLNRPALLLANGVVYVAFASHGDNTPYHGWVVGFNARTLREQGVFNSTPNGGLGGVWESGDGPAVDATSNLFIITGNGTFDGTAKGDFSDSYIKLTPGGTTLKLADYFTPYNQASLSALDADVGGGGLVVLPDAAGSAAHPHLLVGAGKDAMIYLLDRDDLGRFNSSNNNQIVQSLPAGAPSFSTPAYFGNTLYYIFSLGTLQAFSCSNGLLGATPYSVSQTFFPGFGATPSISANGTSNGIVWALQSASSAVLCAFNATNVALELYSSQQAGWRDATGPPIKFTVPTVAGGRVFVGTSSALYVFGIGQWAAPPGISPNGCVFTNSVTATISSSVPGAQIYYSPAYTTALTLTNTTILHAIAFAPNQGHSDAATALFISTTPTTTIAGFGGNGSGWTLNGGALATNDVLTLTDGMIAEARSAFFNIPQFIATFDAQFVYQSGGGANGAAFVLQNSAGGPTVVGGDGGCLAYCGIAPSAAIEFNLYSGEGGSGTSLATNGATGGYISTYPLELGGGDSIRVRLTYDGTNLVENLLDVDNGETYETTNAVNLPAAVGGGNTAFIGFTGATGGVASIQTISEFVFGSDGADPILTAAVAGNQINISWAPSSLSYVLEFTTNLTAPVVWNAAPQIPTSSGNRAAVTLPIGSTNTFYRLRAP
jgi:hypothetical protein